MNPRFPSIDKIKLSISHTRGEMMYPAMTGALTTYYRIASEEFEKLRSLAQAALSGDLYDRTVLEGYLQAVDDIAEFYVRTDAIAEQGKCELEAEIVDA